MSTSRYIRNCIRWFFLCIFHPLKTRHELDQYNFWFQQTQDAFDRAKAAKTQKEFLLAKSQFQLAERRYWKHSKYICP